MSTATKSKSKSSNAVSAASLVEKKSEPVITPVPTPVETPVVAPTSSKKKSKKETETVAKETVTVPPEPVSLPVENVTMNVSSAEAEGANGETVDDLSVKCAEFYSQIQKLSGLMTSIKSEFRVIERTWNKKLRVASKSVGKKKSGNRAPSGFIQPTRISDELAAFLGKEPGTMMARTEVTKELNAYIRTKNLQDASNGRKINANAELSALLKLSPGQELTYFNLQRFMSPHFSKKSDAVTA